MLWALAEGRRLRAVARTRASTRRKGLSREIMTERRSWIQEGAGASRIRQIQALELAVR